VSSGEVSTDSTEKGVRWPSRSGHRGRRFFLAVLLSFLCAVIPRTHTARATSPSASLGAVAYFTDAQSWSNLIATPGLGHIIVNNYQAGDVPSLSRYIDLAHAMSPRPKVYGYIPAGYAPVGSNGVSARTADSIQSNISALFQTYPTIDGVFLDEIAVCNLGGNSSIPDFYVNLRFWIRTNFPEKLVVLNPGSALCAEFEPAADIFMFFENSGSFYTSQFLPFYTNAAFDWIRNLPDERVWFSAYGVPQTGLCPLFQDFVTQGAGVVWADDVDGPATYNVLPSQSYLATMSQCALGGSDPTPTPTRTAVSGTAGRSSFRRRCLGCWWRR
jgi:Spherulation-specific family 4